MISGRHTANRLFSPHMALKYALRVQRTVLCTGILRPSLSSMVRSDQSGFSNQLPLVSLGASKTHSEDYLSLTTAWYLVVTTTPIVSAELEGTLLMRLLVDVVMVVEIRRLFILKRMRVKRVM
jgi:hypothetical protein